MSKITGKHVLQTDSIHLSNGDSIPRIDFTNYGGLILQNGTAVIPELQRFTNTDYYNVPVEMCLPGVFYTDDLKVIAPQTKEKGNRI